ncbi:MAG: zinc-binding dehydrogenase [Streptosporangiaceae bacterium]|nr:zinc-binding dehydrogenase [Streptosporangiaceae bacterium]MBV9855715.1 zinc-binding dehydrogenase [Streptosporangiaceae bacterium]
MHEQGGPEVLKLEEVPQPAAGPGQVLIRNEAIGVSYSEIPMRAGVYPPPVSLPAVFGFEAAGIVTEAGDGSGASLEGKRVVVLSTSFGSYAEYMAVPADSVTVVPGGVTAADAVAVANMAAVALCLLRRARLTGSETVLIEAAAGGVGGYLTQLAREHGAARIIATAGSPAKREHARSLGAGAVVDHTDPGWPDKLGEVLGGAGLDVVFESLGGESAGRLLGAMTPVSGRMLLYGVLNGPPAIAPVDLLHRGLTLTGCAGMGDWLALVQAARGDVLRMVADGRLRPQVDSVLPLSDAARAHERTEARAAMGKVVLVP